MNLEYASGGDGPPIVLLHAFPLTSAMWAAARARLAADGFRVIAPDLPGFGASALDGRPVSIEEMARAVDELLARLNVARAIVAGLSMGGYVALNLYRLSPARFAGLVLCDTTALADTPAKRAGRFELIERIERDGSAALIESMLPVLISAETKTHEPELVATLAAEFSKTDPAGAVNALRAMAERSDHTPLLAKISVPTLLVFGEHDAVTNLEGARAMSRAIPDAELVVIERAGHYSNLERPDAFSNALARFCRRVKF